MLFYTHKELDDIKEMLKSSHKLEYGGRKLVFSNSDAGKYLMQRVKTNKYLGLAMDVTTSEWLLNYPHIDNLRSEALSPGGFLTEKVNGTQIMMLALQRGLIHRTRGTIEPARFYNDINYNLVLGNQTVPGIPVTTFASFKQRYLPVFNEGRSNGMIDEMGNIVVSSVIPGLKAALGPVFDARDVKLVSSEFLTKYNPIAVDKEMKYGMLYPFDAKFKVFDILVETDRGYEFLDYETMKRMVPVNGLVEPVRGWKVSTTAPEDAMSGWTEEGLVYKGPDQYIKIKRDDVLSFERMVGNLQFIIDYAVKHVFEQTSFSPEDVLDKATFLDKEQTEMIRANVIDEMGLNGVPIDTLKTYYISKFKISPEDAERDITRTLNKQVRERIMAVIAAQLLERKIDPKTIYLEVPKYLYFEAPPVYYNEHRGKMVPEKGYGHLISSIVYGGRGSVSHTQKDRSDEK